MNVFHMSTARLTGRPAGLDELTAGADDRRRRRLASTDANVQQHTATTNIRQV